MRMRCNHNKFDATLAQLMTTVGEVAFEYSDNTQEAYKLARLILVKILRGESPGSETIDRRFHETRYLH